MKHSLLSLAASLILACATSGIYAQPPASAESQSESSPAMSDTDSEVGMPDPDDYSGLSRKVLQYSEAFARIVDKTKEPGFSDADWAPLETLINVDKFKRMGVFLGSQAEVIDWEKYKHYISEYGGATSWDGRLRRITEVPGLVILELEEHNTMGEVTHISNTVTIYEFDEEGKIVQLDVYVMPLP